MILSLFAVQQAFFAVNQPTKSAILPKIVPIADLPAANSLNMTVMQAGAIVGPVVGGALIPQLGYSTLYLVDTIFLFATLWAVIALAVAHAGPGRVRAACGRIAFGDTTVSCTYGATRSC